MRKLGYIFVFVLLVQATFGQTATPMKSFASVKANLVKWQNVVKEPQKADFPNEKKFTKAKAKYNKKVKSASTWFNLGKAYKDIYSYAGENLAYNYPQQSVMFLKGTPKEKATQGNKEIWKYDDFTLYFEDERISKWENKETTPDAVQNAIKAFNKAIELDDKGSVKKKAQDEMVDLRNFLKNEGVMYYFDKQLDNAVSDYKATVKIYELPSMAATDTTNYNISEVYYYGAAFADAEKNTEQAIKFYQKNIDYCKKTPKAQQIEFVKSYRFLANDYKVIGDTVEAGKVLLSAYAQFPEEKDILVDLTQYYLDTHQPDKALEFLDKALQKDSDNYLFVFVKGTLYDGFKGKVYAQMDDLRKEVSHADSMRQDSKMTKKAYTTLRASKLKDANALWPEADKFMNEAITEYENALKIKSDYSNASFNLGAVWYNKGAQITKLADLIPSNDMKTYDAEMAKAKEYFLKAKPFLEDALKSDPENIPVMQTLKTVYAKMGKYDKVKELKTKIEAAQAKQDAGGIK